MSGYDMECKATLVTHRSDSTAAKQPPAVSDLSIDHRLWGLNAEDSARVLGLYDQGRRLIPGYNKLQKDIETRQNQIMRSVNGTDDWDWLMRNNVPEFEELDLQGMSIPEQEVILRRVKIKDYFDEEILRDLMGEMEAVEGPIDQIAATCADLQLCPSFTAIILRKLPPELRDQIYHHLWMEEQIKSMDQAISFVPKHHSLDEAGTKVQDLPVPRFANAALVGEDFASEAVATYFRDLSKFELDYRYVRACLERDHFGSMPFSFKEAIRHLVITVDEDFGNLYSGKKIACRALSDSMNSLLMLRERQCLSVEIYLGPDMQWRLALFQALEVIKPVFLMLRKANIDVKILGYDFFSTTEDDDADVLSEQLNIYFTASTPEEWLEMKAKEIKEMPQGPLRQRCKRTLRIMRKNLEFVMRDSRKGAESARASV
ncbi:hypothetical protein BKA58DRAFT_438797 [Alternaria rosae]|uniref:uncharacterized protein n=1 Tax=Alternaria rosae TaxID=1187941 RepID=UPI001E8CD3AE|nr:uncharacterized protein BKA58DRAFT_438797 [Alternaria rosae]KAH6872693.1 hypothetical protein BKA58DRAFT_438797 [Alternaria rosae]